MPDLLHAWAGIGGLIALAWRLGESRRAVPWRAIVVGLGLQVLLGVVFLRFSLVKTVFLKINDALLVLERATQAGTSLVFGYLGGGPAPFAVSDAASNFVLAFRALPIVLLISALSALLFYWGVLPAVVRGISWLLERSMRVGGGVGLSTAADVFVGMVEGALPLRPYHGRRHARHAGRRAAAAQHRRHAGGVRGAGFAREFRHRPLYSAGDSRLGARAARLAGRDFMA